MTRQSKNWRFNRQIGLSVVIELILLAGLILGSWVNLQNQLNLLQHDVTILLQNQKSYQQRIEELTSKIIVHEYRLRAVEKDMAKANTSKKTF
jgi:membrane protein involved in colicin uptake